MHEVGQVPDANEVADRLAIMEVVATYSRGMDRASEDILKNCYWPEAEVDYGAYKGAANNLCERLPDAMKRYENTQHMVSNTLIEISGASARVESYLTAYHYLAQKDEPDMEMTYISRYLDRMEKRGEVWKIAFRKVVITWHQNAQGSQDEERNPSLATIERAKRYPDDPWFSFNM
ncbi:MAG: nuclear transport factor 2 family protein [Gammaproteobacteria bacterium]|jgi:hypothetical protein|nr:nuclear transport factor 2 family protein [Gammaproteobacteria bacterium]MBT4494864.1 nuclear transport factor 2 family protein [Gammaproteobacteria bacterium]MBT7370934.1 nuclear transport factor 2 family protein [Gammaproteobacteria bacterium]